MKQVQCFGISINMKKKRKLEDSLLHKMLKSDDPETVLSDYKKEFKLADY